MNWQFKDQNYFYLWAFTDQQNPQKSQKNGKNWIKSVSCRKTLKTHTKIKTVLKKHLKITPVSINRFPVLRHLSVSVNTTDNTTRNTTDNATDNTTDNTTRNTTDNATDDIIRNTTYNATDNATDNSTDNTTDNTTRNTTDNTTGNITHPLPQVSRILFLLRMLKNIKWIQSWALSLYLLIFNSFHKTYSPYSKSDNQILLDPQRFLKKMFHFYMC